MRQRYCPAGTGGPWPRAQRRDLDLRRRELAFQAEDLGRQLARCHTRLAQARLRQQTISSLRTLFPPEVEQGHVQFNVWERRAGRTLRAEGNAAALLALRQAVAAFEAAGLARLLGGADAETPPT